MNNEKLIVRLITDDLKNSKLIDGLVNLGLSGGDYFLNLSEAVFELMGFDDCKKCEEVHKNYCMRTVLVREFQIDNEEAFTGLANQLYNDLKEILKFQGHDK
ncbi:MAG: hypothetical protein ACO1O6_13725 [Bacteroidota bacterium]